MGTARVSLHGVTGSGRQSVFTQRSPPTRARSALVLVPIGLAANRFRARFEAIAVYHAPCLFGERTL